MAEANILAWLGTSVAGTPLWGWSLFVTLVLGLLALDLGVFHRGERVIGLRESLASSLFYIAAALCFCGWIWFSFGSQAGLSFLTAYVLEKSLSLDNIFVFSLIFGYFTIPATLQHRVLFWGILGVLVLRALLIAAGTALVREFSWLLTVFGILLIGAAVQMFRHDERKFSFSQTRIVDNFRRWFRVTDQLHGRAFFVRLTDDSVPSGHRWFATPLFLALLLVEFADIIFAFESVPAVLSITQEPYLVYTSNIFSILGLRAMYFAISSGIEKLQYLKHTLALILMFIGGKILYQDFGGHVEPLISLSVTLFLLIGGIVYSWWRMREAGKAGSAQREKASSETLV